MLAHGIRIDAITPQNEPHNPKNDPSMVMSAAAQATFIRDHLGPAIRAAGLGTEIFCWDHNCDTPDFPLAILGDPLGAEAYVSGVAWHLYAGSASAISKVHEAYPNQKMYLTEQWVSAGGDFDGDLRWHIKNVVIDTIRNWSRLVLEWNLASDPECGPHTPGGAPDCLGGVTIGSAITRNVSYYIMAHTAKFVRPGSVRIASSEPDSLPNIAFRTPDNRIVLLALNDSAKPKRFSLLYRGKSASLQLDAGAVGTYRWDAPRATA
jgi:glucosylceramidase